MLHDDSGLGATQESHTVIADIGRDMKDKALGNSSKKGVL